MADWSSLVRPSLSELEQFALGQTIAEVKELYGLDEVVKLSWNESLFPPFPGVCEAAMRELENMWMYSEQPYLDFREAAAAYSGTSASRIAPGHGSLALLGIVASAFLGPGENVVVPSLTYGLYSQLSAARGAIVHRVPMRGLAFDLETLAETARRVDARMVWICDPNNPTGTALTADEWRGLLDSLPERCVVVVDEAYGDFTAPAERVQRAVDVEAGRPVVVLRSFSKLFGLAGLRLGYAIVDEPLLPYFDLLEEPFNINCAALAAGITCLRSPDAIAARREEVAAARVQLSDGLRAAGLEPLPSVTNFVLTRLDVDDVALADRLAERGLLIRAGSDYGLSGYARITVAPAPLMERLCAEVADVCASLRH